MYRICTACFVLLAITLSATAQYSSPESAVYDSVGSRWIISNAGRGSIVERSAGGEVREFATNLGGPKGLCIVGDTLYVADVTRVRAYRLTTRALVYRVDVPNSSFLNDCAADDNFLYISEMVRHRIYRLNLETHEVEAWVTNDLDSPNGLFFERENNRLIMVSFRENSPIQAIDLRDGAVSTIRNTELTDLDGIARDGNGNYYISSWGSNSVYRFRSDFSDPTVLEDSLDGPADIYYSRHDNVMAIPCMNIHRVVFRSTPPPEAELRTPTLLNFQDVNVRTRLSHAIEWRNTGGSELVIDSVAHSSEGFEVELPENRRIAPDGSEAVNVIFAPVDSVQYVDTVAIYSNEPLSPRMMVLMGQGVAAPWLVMEGEHDFGRQWIGEVAVWELPINNGGLSTLVLDSAVTNSPNFAARLPESRRIAPEGFTEIGIEFQPGARRDYQDTLWIYSNDPASPAMLSLSGVGISPPTLYVPEWLQFGVVDTSQSKDTTWLWRNDGDDTLFIDSVWFGENSDVFHVLSPLPREIMPQMRTELLVRCTPHFLREYEMEVLIYSNDPGPPKRVWMSVWGTDPNSVEEEELPKEFGMSEGFPAPFNSRVSFRLSLPKSEQVKISLFDISGRSVRVVTNSAFEAGVHRIDVNGAGLVDGVYFLRGEAGEFRFDRKVVFVK